MLNAMMEQIQYLQTAFERIPWKSVELTENDSEKNTLDEAQEQVLSALRFQ